MKGISPLVATVLLIALTVGIGGIVSLFASSLTTSATGVTSNQSESLSRCAGAWINVYSIQSTSVLFSNPNPQTLTGLTIVASDGKTIAAGTSIAPGATNSTSWTSGTNTSVIVRGLCQTLVTVEGKCSNTDQCWDV